MAEVLLSEAEKTFIVHGIQDNLRSDGRRCDDYRYMEVETGLSTNSAGSARLRLANTDVLVGVKVEIGEPKLDKPRQGFVEFFLDCSANAAPEFEGRGGDELATVICSTLARAYAHPSCLDLSALEIISGQKCWVIHVDILLLECGGNLYDAVSIAVKAALFNSRIPTLTVTSSEQGLADIEISDDPFDCKRIDVSNVPCLITVSKMGHSHIIDANMEEETCTLARLIVGVREDGILTTVKKDGRGSLDPESVAEMIETSKRVGQMMNAQLMQTLQEEEKRAVISPESKTTGFLRDSVDGQWLNTVACAFVAFSRLLVNAGAVAE